MAQVPAVLAAERLRTGDTVHLTTEAYRALVLAATGSTRLAEDAARKRAAAQMRSGVTPT